jgi:L-2-hydroxyglutarate oxidase LhgO
MRKKIGNQRAEETAINIKENYEVEYWANILGIRPQVLREVTAKIGTSVRKVKVHLKIK